MRQYYNYLTDKMEDLDPAYMALNLPKSKEEYLERLRERNSPTLTTVKEVLKENYIYPIEECFKTEGDEIVEQDNYIFPRKELLEQLEYLKANPELVDEKIVVDMSKLSEETIEKLKKTLNEESNYLNKRRREGNPLIIWEEVGEWKDTKSFLETWNELKELQKEEAQPYICATDPYTTDGKGNLHIFKKDKDGNIMNMNYKRMSSEEQAKLTEAIKIVSEAPKLQTNLGCEPNRIEEGGVDSDIPFEFEKGYIESDASRISKVILAIVGTIGLVYVIKEGIEWLLKL